MALIHTETIAEAVALAQQASVSSSVETKIRNFYAKHQAVIERYRGALPPLSVVSGLWHESHFDPTHTSDPVIMESGIWSLTPGVALKFNIDPFNMEAGIWGGARLKNERVKEILESYPWLVLSDTYDYAKLVYKLSGSLGMGGFYKVMKLMGYGPTAPESRWVRTHPYLAMRNWFLSPANWSRIPKIGRMGPNIVAGRIVRNSGVEFMKRTGELRQIRKGYYKLVGRPGHLPPFNPARFIEIWTPRIANYYAEVAATPPQARSKFTLVNKYGEATLAAMAGGNPSAWQEVFRVKMAPGLSRTVEGVVNYLWTGTPRVGLGIVVGLLTLGAAAGTVGYYGFRDRRRFRGR